MSKSESLEEEQRMILDQLAEMIIPEDEFDEGLKGIGFSSIIEMRNMYQPWIGDIYDAGIRGIQQISYHLYEKSFIDLAYEQRAEILNMIASNQVLCGVWNEGIAPIIFFTNLHDDACFIYSTDESVCQRIGFQGPSFDKGGYPDYSEPVDL